MVVLSCKNIGFMVIFEQKEQRPIKDYNNKIWGGGNTITKIKNNNYGNTL
jgi:hypothetical protein